MSEAINSRDTDERQPLLAQANQDEEAQERQSQVSNASSTRDRLSHFCAAVSHGRNLLIVGLLILLALCLAIFAGLFFHEQQYHEVSTCQSADCVHAASEILDSIDPDHANIDACSNFDQLVCGGWRQRHDLRPDQGDMFTGTLMSERSDALLRHILEGPLPSLNSSADKKIFTKLKAEYESCTDEKLLQSIGLTPLVSLVGEIEALFSKQSNKTEHVVNEMRRSGDQKVLSRHKPINDLTNVLQHLNQLDISALLDFSVSADDRDPDSQILMLTPPSRIGLPSKEYYTDKAVVSDYRKASAQVLKHFGRDNVSEAVVDLEVSLAAATPPTEDQEDVTKYYNPRTVAETNALLPQVSFDHIISQLAPNGYAPKKLIVGSPTYMKELSQLLSKTNKETLETFFIWKAIQQYEKRVESPALAPLRAFNNKLRGLEPDAKPERWQTCIKAVDSGLGWILSRFYVQAAFSEPAKEFGDQIVSDIKQSFIEKIEKANWITDEVRDRAIKKVHAIDQKIGYPTSNPDILDPAAVKEYYSTLKISKTSFFDNRINIALFDTQRNWAKLGNPTRHDEWGMSVPTVNAYYSPPGNEIVFPAGIMQSPVFYPPSVPQYLTYGGFGAVSGHELSHAFDSTGSHYDETGNYTDWFDAETQAEFDKRTRCFDEEYSNFTIPDPNGGKPIHVNGHLTLGENMADASGLSASFQAWKRRALEADPRADGRRPSISNLLLPGLRGFTPEQLFFVSYGVWWCDKSTKEKAVERIYTDPHAPKWTRIVGTMMNSAEFRGAWGCESREPTCKLW